MSDEHLTPEEDAHLRRLHLLQEFGTVADSVTSRYAALRGRDRRTAVREPDEEMVASPVTPSARPVMPVQRTGSAAEGAVGDAGEVLADRPEPRGGIEIFRR